MPKASDPRIVVRIGQEDADKLEAVAKTAGVGSSTLLREAAIRGDRYIEIGRQLAEEKSSGGSRTVAAPPADPVPPAATPAEIIDQISKPYTHSCPVPGCDFRSYVPTAICPTHGRRATLPVG